MQDEAALVTGGGRGFGLGIARHLREAGATVYITGRTASVLDDAGERFDLRPVVADVTRGADWDRVLKQIRAEAGPLSILVNNAGGGGAIDHIERQSDEQIEAAVAANLVGAMLGCRRVVPMMKDREAGTIINISSVCGRYAWPGWSVYSAAKAGLEQFGRCLHTEVRESGVRLITLVPSWGATEFASAARLGGHPTADADIRKRCIQPNDIGRVVVDLCRLPLHLTVPEMLLLPLVQAIEPF